MDDCLACERAERVGARVVRRFPSVTLVVIHLDEPERAIPPEIFAAPTFRMNGRILSLGTPTLDGLTAAVRHQLAA